MEGGGGASLSDNYSLPALSDASVDLDLIKEILLEDSLLGAPEPAELPQFTSETAATSLTSGDGAAAHRPDIETTACYDCQPSAGSEPGRCSGLLPALKERLNQALSFIGESQRGRDALVQMWVPIRRGGSHVLITRGQPFSLTPGCRRLMNYRRVSTGYQFAAAGEDSGEALGLPGRVFLGKLPEWSPDVRYFSRFEYPRVNHAQHYDVRGSLALPIFERGGGRRTCLGVVEVVLTTEKIKYRSDLEHICNALQAVDLGSCEPLDIPHVKMKSFDYSYTAALPEISAVLRAVCRSHALPLAQTWMRCADQGRTGSRHSDDNYGHCVSTVDAACFVNDPSFFGFHEACSEHHLLRGQGVAGRAFATNQPCFSPDLTALGRTTYPLLHHARMFGLRAAVAVRLRSVETGKTDFVLEFLLPVGCAGRDEQRALLNALSDTVQRVCWSLRVLTPEEVVEAEAALRADEQLVTADGGFCPEESAVGRSPAGVAGVVETRQPADRPPLFSDYASPEFGGQELQGFSDGIASSTCNPGLAINGGMEFGDPAGGEPSFPPAKRPRTEKIIGLQVLQQYFAGSLKDAAKSIGVCPTTLKRICRQHGITRWPSRKIKKVDHSLRKLQAVLDSIHGVDGSFQLSSLYANIPKEENSGPDRCNDTPRSTARRREELLPPPPDDQPRRPSTARASASTNSHSPPTTQSSGSTREDSGAATQSCPGRAAEVAVKGDMLIKRTRSDMGLRHAAGQKAVPEGALARSRSLKLPSLRRHNPAGGESTPSASHMPGAGGLPRVKAMYGKEKVRFRLQPAWRLRELKEDIFRRFGIGAGDGDGVSLKYLDDDDEWVLLACDADLLECTDVHRSSRARTIKISVQDRLAVSPG